MSEALSLTSNNRPVLADILLVAVVAGNFTTNELACGRTIGVEIVRMGNGIERESGELFGTVPTISQSARLTRMKRPSRVTSAMPMGASSNVSRNRSFRFLQRSFETFALADVARERLPRPSGRIFALTSTEIGVPSFLSWVHSAT
jgi:hypothetical protein